MNCSDATTSLGSYIIGSLDFADRAAVEAHLKTCPACRDMMADLAALPGLLGKLSLDDVLPDADPVIVERHEPPPDLYDRLVARVEATVPTAATARPRRSASTRLVAVAAAVVVVLTGVGLGAGVWRSTHPRSTFSALSNGVRMSVSLNPQSTGTGLRVTVSGLPEDEHCRLIAVNRDGTRQLAGSWDATYSGVAQETATTTIARSDLRRLVLLGTGSHPLVSVDV